MSDAPKSRRLTEKDFNAHFVAVGLVAMNWALFESHIDSYSFALSRINEDVAACFAANIIGWNNKMNTYIALARLRKANDSIVALNKIVERAQGLAEQRNRIVHDPWMITRDTTFRVEMTAKRRLVYERVFVAPEDIHNCAENIGKLNADFHRAHFAVMKEIRLSRRTPKS